MDTRGTSLWHRVTASHGFWDRPRRTGGETGTECPAAPIGVRRPDILGPGRVQPPCSLASCPGGAVTNRPQLGAQNYVRRSFRGPAGRESDREASEGLVRLRLSGGSPRPPPPSGRFVRGLTAPRLEPRSLLLSSRGHGPGRVRVVSLPLGHCSLGPDLGDLLVARLSLQAQQPKRVPLAGTRAFSGDTAPPQWKPSWGRREGSGDGEAKARSTC